MFFFFDAARSGSAILAAEFLGEVKEERVERAMVKEGGGGEIIAATYRSSESNKN